MITTHQNREFIASIFDHILLESAVEWIGNNMSIDEVFSEKDIDQFFEDWAYDNGYVKEGDKDE